MTARPRGDTRAWDAQTGKLVWTFHTVPRPGELGYDTWTPDSAKNRSGVNVWGYMTVDEKRGIVYMPLGAPNNDRSASIAPATICSAPRSSRWMPPPASISGTSSSSITTSGT